MRKKKYIRYALLSLLILIALVIPAIQGSAQSNSTPEAPAEEDEDALHTPPATTTIAEAITKTIAIKETSGTLDCSQTGLSGEKGCHQFMPSTWRAYSVEVYGSVVEQTPEAAEYVTRTKVQRWLDDGYTPRQIFLIWNQGNPGKCISGWNSHNVYYDSCAYAEEALAILESVIHSG